MRPFGGGAPVDWLIVGLGNPGREHADTRHNVGFMIADRLAERWNLGRAKDRFRGRIAEGRALLVREEFSGMQEGGPDGPVDGIPAKAGAGGGKQTKSAVPRADQRVAAQGGGESTKSADPRARSDQRVAVLWPQTYMNDVGRSVGPARGSLKVALDHVLVVHDEIDLPFGDVRTRLGGGLAGHNGLKSLKRDLGSADFVRVRVGVGRPKSTDPEIVSSYVLGRFRESSEEVQDLIDRACQTVERVLLDEGV